MLEMKQKEKWLRLPKVELHCHLDGSLSREFVEKRFGKQVPLSELQADRDCESLAQYLEKFSLPLSCLQDEEGLRGAGYDFVRSIARENVRYAEVRFAPALSAHDSFSYRAVIQALLEGLESGKEEFGVSCNVIVCAMRGHSEEQNLSMLKAAREFLGQGVCGADLAGNEAAYPMKDFMELFREAAKMEMPFTIHGGECGNPRNIEEALGVGAARIGHGIAMRGQEHLKALCRRRGTGIEMCPVSNLQTKAVKGPEEYPLREFLDAGLKVSINTDNRTVSGTTLTEELNFIQENWGISDEEILLLMKNGAETSFAEETLKDRMLKEIETWEGADNEYV